MNAHDREPRPHHHDGDDGVPNVEAGERVLLNGPSDLVAALPYLLGFTPEPGDIVVAAFTVRQLRLTAVAHLDLDHPDDPAGADLGDLVPAVWAQITDHLSDTDTDAVQLVAYLPSHAVPALQALARQEAPLLNEVLRVHAGRWWSLTCPAPGTCCPPDGSRLPSPSPALAAVFTAHGMATVPDRAALGDCLRYGPPELLATVATHLATLTHAAGTSGEGYEQVRRAHADFGEGPITLDPVTAGGLLYALADLEVRDRALAWSDEAAWWLWLELIRHAPPTWSAPVATLIAALAYRQGHAPLARIAAHHALNDNPDYTMAGFVLSVINQHIHPATFSQMITEALAAAHVGDHT